VSLIFAQPRHEYQSYTDFWQLVRLSGYPIIYQDEIDPQSDNTYIFTGADAHVSFPDGNARIIYWLLEWYGDYVQKPGVTETWCCNKTFAHQLGVRYVPMGSHPQLGTLESKPLKYDIIHLSYSAIHRRRLTLDKLIDKGLKIAPNGWGEFRDRMLRESRIMLHIHQNGDYPGIAPLRVALGAAYGLPIICENGWSSAPYGNAIILSKYGDIEHAVKRVLKNYDYMKSIGLELHQLLCHDLEFSRVVEAHL
jgi:hypothetical protein